MATLSDRTLPTLEAALAVPTYDRSLVRPGIVHLGVGAFHRSHQAMYLDQLMREGTATEWGVCGVGLLDGDRRMQEALDPQDCLYTLVVKHADGTTEPRVIGSMVRYLFAPDDPQAVLDQLVDEGTRIVSLTITEGGYNTDPVTGAFVADAPHVVADLAAELPRTAFGLVVEALARRRALGRAPFTVMSCDNIQGNGDVARRSFSSYASLRDEELGAWVDREVPFPNSMVDRITPQTTDEDRRALAAATGVEDRWPVVCEPFHQWVLEDRFPLGRPPLEDVGVQLVQDVEPYELMKLRLLNAGHQALAYLGHLAGHRLVHDAASDPVFSRFLLDYMTVEATPTLHEVPGVDLPVYRTTLVERFSNPEVRDTIARLAAESSDRIPTWLLPVVRHNLAHGGEIERSVLVVAAWARYAEGVDEQGEPIVVVDRLKEPLMAAAARWREDPLAFVGQRELFGDLVDDERFTTAYTAALISLHERGARATLEDLLARTG